MEIVITFRDGPIEAEITANEEDDYDDVLESLSEFVEGYTPKTSESVNYNVGSSDSTEVEEPQEDETEQISTNDLSNLSELPEDKLYRFVKVGRVNDGDIDELPRIIGDTNVLGDSEEERLLNSSILIMTIFDDFHDIDTVKTSDLKQALADSGFDGDRFSHNIDGVDESEIYLNRRGRGPSATTEIRPPGKDEAYRLFSEVTTEI